MTLSRRRSAVLWGFVGGGAAEACGAVRLAPQEAQNFDPDGLAAPQLAQLATIGAPHLLQKRLASEIAAPQLGQCMRAAYGPPSNKERIFIAAFLASSQVSAIPHPPVVFWAEP
jgi:hypothetical protein